MGCWAQQSTPCGTRTRNLRIRSPTPCPLGQGGCRASDDGIPSSSRLAAVHECCRRRIEASKGRQWVPEKSACMRGNRCCKSRCRGGMVFWGMQDRCLWHRGYGATAARLTPDQKVGSSNLSALIALIDFLDEIVQASHT